MNNLVYRDAFVDSGAGVANRFFHTAAQSLSGHSRSIRIPIGFASACMSVRRTSYTGCPRRNVPDFGRVFFMLKYTDITQNIYVQS